MRLKRYVGKKTAAIAVAAVFAFALSSCGFADTSGAPAPDSYTQSMYYALNVDRVANGLPPLTRSPKLENTAGTWAWQMASVGTLYHQNLTALLYSADYSYYRTLGENIIVGPGSMTPGALEAAWRASPPHWANITSRAFNVVGIGYWRGPDGRIWAVQDFGGL
jgi:uncharacterized protein YkwD